MDKPVDAVDRHSDAATYQRCVRTVMDTTDPEIWFDEQGVSSHALRFDATMKDQVRAAQAGELIPELNDLIAQIKKDGEGKPYDCIVGVSGGVDSTYLILQAVKLGLRPLAVHFDSGWNSELAVDNIHNIVTRLDLDLYTHVIDWREMRDLQLAFFKASLANCDVPTDHAFGWVAYQQAVKYGVKYILSGANLASESILPQSWGYNASDAKHVKAVHKQFGTGKLKTYPLMGLFKRHIWYPYARGVKTVKPLNLMPYRYDQAKQAITDEVGWRDYGGKHYESVFTRYFQGYYLPKKFGFDKRLAHYSSLILSEQMTRDEALNLLKTENYPESLRKQDHEFIAKKLGLTVSELDAIYDLPLRDYTDYPNAKRQWDVAMAAARVPVKILKKLGLRP
ncbi:N-acetyl sugar amidotransferase [Microbacterium soli]|uniref:N-acetyl sugar amidotransferase n=1 Tax=Microbacterium soli TaxID=446075 RepID=A0ABP7MP81_9MICO